MLSIDQNYTDVNLQRRYPAISEYCNVSNLYRYGKGEENIPKEEEIQEKNEKKEEKKLNIRIAVAVSVIITLNVPI
jgi:hypothetical protein